MPGHRKNVVLFYRDFLGFSGGHLKVWHYFCHVRDSLSHEARIYFTTRSRLDEGNPWFESNTAAYTEWNPADADVLFAAGLDWDAIPVVNGIPVVNLIQGMRHTEPDDPRYAFLSRRAVRICVSEEVADAVRATGRVNGPVFTIPNAIDHDSFPKATSFRDIPLLICGLKNPHLAKTLEGRLTQHGIRAVSQTEHLHRSKFLSLLGRAKVAVLLPWETEGCYLPSLEAMAMGALVVCPDCVGNRTFCRDGDNSFRPDYAIQAIEQAVLRACSLSEHDHERMVSRGFREAESRDLSVERRLFLDILEHVPSLV